MSQNQQNSGKQLPKIFNGQVEDDQKPILNTILTYLLKERSGRGSMVGTVSGILTKLKPFFAAFVKTDFDVMSLLLIMKDPEKFLKYRAAWIEIVVEN